MANIRHPPYYFTYPIPDEAGGEIIVYIDIELYRGMCNAIIEAKIEADKELPRTRQSQSDVPTTASQPKMGMIASLMVLGGTLVKKGQLEREDQNRILYTINHFSRLAQLEDWEQDLDPILSISYHQLERKLMSRIEVYQLARSLLGYEEAGDTEAWRRRVDRWAHRKGLPPVGKRGRPKKSE